MKKTLLAITLISSAQLSLAQVRTPTMYTCKGNDTLIQYSTTSFAGKALMSISGKHGRFSGTGVKALRTGAGLIVSSFNGELAAGGATESVSLVIPTINLGTEQEVTFKTIAILSRSGHYYPGQPVPTGVLQNQKYVGLVCKAQAVMF